MKFEIKNITVALLFFIAVPLATLFALPLKAEAAISLHNSATGQSSDPATTVSATLTAAAGEIVIVEVNNEVVSGAVKTVTGISDGTTNVYTRRFSASQAPEPFAGASEEFEVWWAYVANPLTAATITATLSGTIDDAVIITAGYQGFTGTAYQTNPWDTNASLPKTAQSAAVSFASVSGVSTNSTAGTLIAGLGSLDSQTPGDPTGFSLVGQLKNTGATNEVQGTLWNEAYSSAQSSVTVTTTAGTNGWIFYVDALTSPAGGGGATGRIIRIRGHTRLRGGIRLGGSSPVPHAAIALIAHTTGRSTDSNGFTTGAIDTTGANFIIIGLATAVTGGTISDSKGNTWHPLTEWVGGAADRQFRFFYCQSCTVGSGHTFTVTGTGIFPLLLVEAFSGIAAASSFDVQNGNGPGICCGNSISTNSVTPSAANELVIAGLEYDVTDIPTIDSGFTITDTSPAGPFGAQGGQMAYLIETTATAQNPTFSWSPDNSRGTTGIATFK
jgi:hypothetical protein